MIRRPSRLTLAAGAAVAAITAASAASDLTGCSAGWAGCRPSRINFARPQAPWVRVSRERADRGWLVQTCGDPPFKRQGR